MNETKQRVKDLIEQGYTVRQIAYALGISTQAVYGHLRRLGITPPSKKAAKR